MQLGQGYMGTHGFRLRDPAFSTNSLYKNIILFNIRFYCEEISEFNMLSVVDYFIIVMNIVRN